MQFLINMKITTKDFIEKARSVHGDKYDYSKVEYKNAVTKVCIICPEHGEFWQAPSNHINSRQGCPMCGGKALLTQDEFIRRARETHGNKYDYSNTSYINMKEKVTIICPEHGGFLQTPHNHLNGAGCPNCQKNHIQYNTQKIIESFEKIHGNKYDYSKVNYINGRAKVCVVCPEHGEFFISSCKHLQGQGCKKCGKKSAARKSAIGKEAFIEKARLVHGDKYDYSNVEYKRANSKVNIICPKHGGFWQTPHHHLSSHGCPLCASSLLNLKISKLLDENGIKYEREKTFPWLKNIKKLFLDFFLPEYNIAIECHGRQHFEAIDYFGGIDKFLEGRKRDEEKHRLCENNNIKIVYFTNVNNTEVIYPYEVLHSEADLISKIKENDII